MRQVIALALTMLTAACREAVNNGPPANVDVALEFPSLTIGLCLSVPCLPDASQAAAVVIDASGNYLRDSVIWSSSDQAVATVVSTGPARASVRPLAKGTATIRATVIGTNPPISGGAPITVRLGGILGIELSLSTNTLAAGQTMNLTLAARNSGEEPLALQGPGDCLLALKVLNSSGSVVYNSDRNCVGATINAQVGPGQQRLQAFNWNGSSNAGTRVSPGTYSVHGTVLLVSELKTSPPQSIVVQ